jgi:hypothetical protein
MAMDREKRMKTFAVVVASVFNLLAFVSAYAHGDHDATHGGTVGVGSDAILVEFVMENGTINLYVHEETGEPLSIKNLKGTLTLIAPQRPAQEVKLVVAGEHKFKAPGIAPVRGDRMVARITLPSGEETESAALFSGVNLEKPGPSLSVGASVLPESK